MHVGDEVTMYLAGDAAAIETLLISSVDERHRPRNQTTLQD
jgi:hypothetical protein